MIHVLILFAKLYSSNNLDSTLIDQMLHKSYICKLTDNRRTLLNSPITTDEIRKLSRI